MPTLLLINGAPGTGKSTLARRWADSRPLTLVLDLDLLRAMLGTWRVDILAAGRRARLLALAAAEAQLRAGGDVVVPQLLARPELVETLDALCRDVGARFVEVALVAEPEDLAARLTARAGASPDDPWSALEGAPTAERVRELADAVDALVGTRPGTHRVTSVPGDVDGTYDALDVAVDGR